jgi:hypothetical protein
MKKFLLLLLSLISFEVVRSQAVTPEVIASSGSHFSGGGIELSWTLGEVAIETVGGSSAQLTQGFHQPFAIVNGIEEESETLLSVYPNPTNGILHVRSEKKDLPIEFIRIFSIQGQLLATPAYTNNQVDISFLAAGIYILKIQSGQHIFTFRLIKN